MTYLEAQELFKSARNPSRGKPIGNNLSVILDHRDESIAKNVYGIEHHTTTIVEILCDDSVVLHNGGWFSVTTRKHINTYLPQGANLYQRSGEWIIQDADSNVSAWYDGIRIGCDGVILGEIRPLPPIPKRSRPKAKIEPNVAPQITELPESLPTNVVCLASFKARKVS